MSLKKRFLLTALVLFAQINYLIINQSISGGTLLKTFIDDWIPLRPIWIFPYDVLMPLWAGFLIAAAWKMDQTLLRTFVIASLITILPSMLLYVLWPTYVSRPELIGNDWATALLRYTYTHDHPNNAFPSGHVYLACHVAYFWSRWKPKLGWGLLLMVLIVMLSTLFIKQHYFLDLVGGLIFAGVGIGTANWLVTGRLLPQQSK